MSATTHVRTTKTTARGTSSKPREVVVVHTKLLRLALGMDESRAYWENVDPTIAPASRAVAAFEQRWFGGKSLERTKFLITTCVGRYDAFPAALDVLRQWQGMSLETRKVICHWHLQLADPLYRAFTADYLNERRSRAKPQLDRNAVFRWVKSQQPDRWGDATCMQFASKLLSAAAAAGLVSSAKRGPRGLLLPKVPAQALAYLMYLLRGIHFEGTLVKNSYLTSVALDGGIVEQRLRDTPGITFRRMQQLTDFEWAAPDLRSWAKLPCGGHETATARTV